MSRRIPLLIVCFFGLAVMAVCGFYVLQDWAALRRAFTSFEATLSQNKDLRSVTVANALQTTYRMNCFADGVGFLLGGIIASIGIHGLCLLPLREATHEDVALNSRPHYAK